MNPFFRVTYVDVLNWPGRSSADGWLFVRWQFGVSARTGLSAGAAGP
jgi:hypothetical protein